MQTGPTYKLIQVKKILAIATSFIDFKTKHIFLATGGESQHALMRILLQETQSEAEDDIEKIVESIKLAIKKHNDDVPTHRKEVQSLRELLVESSEDSVELVRREYENQFSSPITDVEWAVVCKLLMMKGEILDPNQQSWAIFFAEIQKMQEYIEIDEVQSIPIAKLNPAFVQKVFRDFIGQLCIDWQFEAAQVLHTYFHFANRLLQESNNNGLDRNQIAFALGASLCHALLCFGKLKDTTPKEYAVFKHIVDNIIGDSIYNTPFHVNLYEQCKQESLTEMPTNEEDPTTSFSQKFTHLLLSPRALRHAIARRSHSSHGLPMATVDASDPGKSPLKQVKK